MATVKRNGSFAEFWVNDACVWSVNMTTISTHQELAGAMHALADDFEWFAGDIVRDFQMMGERHLNRF